MEVLSSKEIMRIINDNDLDGVTLHGGEPLDQADELLKMQENSILYSMATRRMSNIITEMKTVVNVGK